MTTELSTNSAEQAGAPGLNPRVVWGLATAALGLTAAGWLWTVHTLKNDPTLDCCSDPAFAGVKSPQEFGLPQYPGAFSFASSETKSGKGSAAFRLKHGDAKQVAAFYRTRLEAEGWRFLGQSWQQTRYDKSRKDLPPGGLSLRWTQPRDGRHMTLIAIDFPQKGSTTQAVLSWKPKDP
jgi:hypothetical protein